MIREFENGCGNEECCIDYDAMQTRVNKTLAKIGTKIMCMNMESAAGGGTDLEKPQKASEVIRQFGNISIKTLLRECGEVGNHDNKKEAILQYIARIMFYKTKKEYMGKEVNKVLNELNPVFDEFNVEREKMGRLTKGLIGDVSNYDNIPPLTVGVSDATREKVAMHLLQYIKWVDEKELMNFDPRNDINKDTKIARMSKIFLTLCRSKLQISNTKALLILQLYIELKQHQIENQEEIVSAINTLDDEQNEIWASFGIKDFGKWLETLEIEGIDYEKIKHTEISTGITRLLTYMMYSDYKTHLVEVNMLLQASNYFINKLEGRKKLSTSPEERKKLSTEIQAIENARDIKCKMNAPLDKIVQLDMQTKIYIAGLLAKMSIVDDDFDPKEKKAIKDLVGKLQITKSNHTVEEFLDHLIISIDKACVLKRANKTIAAIKGNVSDLSVDIAKVKKEATERRRKNLARRANQAKWK